jgi:hypothetical protein
LSPIFCNFIQVNIIIIIIRSQGDRIKSSDNNEVHNFDDNDYDDSNDNGDSDDDNYDNNYINDDNDNDGDNKYDFNEIINDKNDNKNDNKHYNDDYMECKAIVKSLNELGLMSQLPDKIRIGLYNNLVSTQNHGFDTESVKVDSSDATLIPSPLDDELAFFSAIKFKTNANSNASTPSLTITPDDELAYLDQLDFKNTNTKKFNEKNKIVPKISVGNNKKIVKKNQDRKIQESEISKNSGVSTQSSGVRADELIKLLGKSSAVWDDFRYNFIYVYVSICVVLYMYIYTCL